MLHDELSAIPRKLALLELLDWIMVAYALVKFTLYAWDFPADTAVGPNHGRIWATLDCVAWASVGIAYGLFSRYAKRVAKG